MYSSSPVQNCLLLTEGMLQTTALGEAYGTCVILVSFLTTCMVSVVALIVWKLPIYLVLPVFIVFALWDGMFLSSALSKVPHGAWFTLMVAAILSCIFLLWRFGKEEQWTAEESDNVPLSQTTILRDKKLHLQDNGSTVTPIRGLGIFFDKSGSAAHTPAVFLHFTQKFSAMPEVSVFLHLRPLSIPTVAPNERYAITRCYTYSDTSGKQVIPNCYRIIVRHGYTDEVITPDLGILVLDLLRGYLTEQSVPKSAIGASEELDALVRAWRSQVLYIVGKEQLKIAAEANIFRRLILVAFLFMREYSRAKIQHLNVEIERVVEVGFLKEM